MSSSSGFGASCWGDSTFGTANKPFPASLDLELIGFPFFEDGRALCCLSSVATDTTEHAGFPRRRAYNDEAGGNIQALVLLAETPLPARFFTRKVVREGRVGVSFQQEKSDDEETF
jgi:hypothetical protein